MAFKILEREVVRSWSAIHFFFFCFFFLLFLFFSFSLFLFFSFSLFLFFLFFSFSLFSWSIYAGRRERGNQRTFSYKSDAWWKCFLRVDVQSTRMSVSTSRPHPSRNYNYDLDYNTGFIEQGMWQKVYLSWNMSRIFC